MRGFFNHPRFSRPEDGDERGHSDGFRGRNGGHRERGHRGEGRGGRFGFGGFGAGPFERGRGRGEARGFGHGGLRLVLLKLIADKPSHGYELIKEIEDRSRGAYTPSPGVIYPTLSWLEDEGYIVIQPGDDGRKQASITETGLAFLTEKTEEVDALFERMNHGDKDDGQGDYSQLFRAMGNLKMALKMRGMKPLSQEQIDTAVDLIDELARKLGRL